MGNIYKGEMQDNKGNTIYPHTESDVVFCSDGETAQEKLTKYEDALGEVTGKTDSTEVSDTKILATSKAVNDLKVSLNNSLGMDLAVVNGKPMWKERGADTFNPFSGINEIVYLNSNQSYANGVSGYVDCSASDIDDYSCIVAVSSIGTRDTCTGVDISCDDEIILKKSQVTILCGQCIAFIKPSGNSITVRTTTSINVSSGVQNINIALYGIK